MNLDEKIIEACKTEPTMAKARAKVGIKFSTFKRIAVKLGVYNPNQSGKGTVKGKFTLEDFLSNKKPIKSQYLKERLVKAGLKEWKCECCGISEWNGRSIVLELDHKDGNNKNNSLDNLQILCPNCHSQTPTFRGRKI
jgi:hypothetical protein